MSKAKKCRECHRIINDIDDHRVGCYEAVVEAREAMSPAERMQSLRGEREWRDAMHSIYDILGMPHERPKARRKRVR